MKLNSFYFFLSGAITLSCNLSQDKYILPGEAGRLIIEDLLSREELMLYKTDHFTGIHYAEACAGFGAAKLAGILADTSALYRLKERYDSVVHKGLLNKPNHVDANVYGILPLELYIQLKDRTLLELGLSLADKQWEDTIPGGLTAQTRYWIDDIWMIGSLQVQAYRVTGNEIYLNRAAMEINSYLEKLQQPNGLFYHGENAPFFWGRGNGWVAAGLAELLSELPDSNAYYPLIVEGYKKMMNALLLYQAEDGMWRQLIDKDGSWKETSVTAMFGYAIATGVKKGILEDAFTSSYKKAWSALTTYINSDGKVSDVCAGTGKSDDVNYYLERPKITGDLHGQAAVLWFAYRIADM
jgi:unsaturated rhamnogalacturonyl hydrolase